MVLVAHFTKTKDDKYKDNMLQTRKSTVLSSQVLCKEALLWCMPPVSEWLNTVSSRWRDGNHRYCFQNVWVEKRAKKHLMFELKNEEGCFQNLISIKTTGLLNYSTFQFNNSICWLNLSKMDLILFYLASTMIIHDSSINHSQQNHAIQKYCISALDKCWTIIVEPWIIIIEWCLHQTK